MSQILLVEDDLWLAELYQRVLTEAGYQVLHGASAKQGLQLLDAHAGSITLIILDMFLPDHNGVEFLHEVASYNDCNSIPVMLLSSVSASDFSMSTERWRQYGVQQYLYKPSTKPQDIVVAVKKQLLQAAI